MDGGTPYKCIDDNFGNRINIVVPAVKWKGFFDKTVGNSSWNFSFFTDLNLS